MYHRDFQKSIISHAQYIAKYPHILRWDTVGLNVQQQHQYHQQKQTHTVLKSCEHFDDPDQKQLLMSSFVLRATYEVPTI